MTAMQEYWKQWAERMHEAPHEFAKRMDLMTRAPGSSLSLADAQRMLWQNWVHATEAWWSWWKAAHALHWPNMAQPPGSVAPGEGKPVAPEATAPAAPAHPAAPAKPAPRRVGSAKVAAPRAEPSKAHAKHARHR